MASGSEHVFGFSPNGKLFALINDQGILKVWDTETNVLKQEYTPNLHLAEPCTALVWVEIMQEQMSKKQRRSISGTSDESLYLALGTSSGNVSLYSYALGKIARNLHGEGHIGKVTCIIYDNSSHLYTSGEDCQIIVWSINKEKSITSWNVGAEKPYSIAYMANSNNLVIGARQISVYSVETQNLIQTFTGHVSEVTHMCQLVNGHSEYVITASKMERIICLWKIGKKGRNKTALASFLMEDKAHCLSCQVDEEGVLKLASVTRSGVIHFYITPLDNIKTEKPIKPKVTIVIASDSTTIAEPILAIVASIRDSKEMLCGYGDTHFIVFERITPNFAEKLQLLVRSDPKQLLKTLNKKNASANTSLKTITPTINTNNVDYKSSVAVSKKKVKAIEMPMETRLQNLNINNSGSVPQAQSQVQLLIQALHSKDARLLQMVLSANDLKTIELTLKRLPVMYVGALVTELTLLMQKKRTQVEFAMNWLKILVQTHSSQLMALGADDLLNKFGPCVGIIEHRANCLKEVSKLNGRLQLLVSQIQRKTEKDNLNSEDVLIYEDNDSSNSDIDVKSGDIVSSDDEWDEKEEEEENPIEEMET